jgi:hypothetical protein
VKESTEEPASLCAIQSSQIFGKLLRIRKAESISHRSQVERCDETGRNQSRVECVSRHYCGKGANVIEWNVGQRGMIRTNQIDMGRSFKKNEMREPGNL